MTANKTLVLYLDHRVKQHRCTEKASKAIFNTLRFLASSGDERHVIGAQNIYDMEKDTEWGKKGVIFVIELFMLCLFALTMYTVTGLFDTTHFTQLLQLPLHNIHRDHHDKSLAVAAHCESTVPSSHLRFLDFESLATCAL